MYGTSDPLEVKLENGGGNFKTGYNIKTGLNEWFIGQEGSAITGFRITDVDAAEVRFQIDESTGNVGIGTTSPNASALLHVSATNKGLLIPNVALTTITDNITIPSPAASLLVYNTNLAMVGGTGVGYYYNSNTAAAPAWVMLATAGSGNAPWSRSAPNIFLSNNTDSVGIGTKTPLAKLQVVKFPGTGGSSAIFSGGSVGIGDGNKDNNQAIFVWLNNASGASINVGEIVIVHPTTPMGVTTTNIAAHTAVTGVALDNIPSGTDGRIAISGVVFVKIGAAAVSAGQHVITSTTAGQADGVVSPPNGSSIGVWLENGAAGALKRVLLK